MLRRFIDYYKPHRKLFFADLFFAFLLAVRPVLPDDRKKYHQ